MAKENQNLDQLIKNKLEHHSEKPSELAWERLENKLSKKSDSKKPIIWWSVAASVSILVLAGYFYLQNGSSLEEQPFLSEENPTEQLQELEVENQPENLNKESETQVFPEETEKEQEENINEPKQKTETPTQNLRKVTPKPTEAPKELIASAEEKVEVQEKSEATPIRVPESSPQVTEVEIPELKELDLNKAVAEVEKEAPAYTLKIYSDGIEEEENDNNLITGIGKKVDKVEGLLGKVDQGFADLQDAKNNLFASLTTKKERSAQKP